MLGFALEQAWQLMGRGGVVMWPLLGVSLVGMTLVLQRCWFWAVTNRRGRLVRLEKAGRLLRQGKTHEADQLLANDSSVYGQAVRALLQDGGSDAAVAGVIEAYRPAIERYMSTLSTIITVAPMLGILGTVTGIISSFQVLSGQSGVVDPREVGSGIAEALLTTAAGLVIAIFVLLPYNAFRTQVDRTLGRIESLAGSLVRGVGSDPIAPGPPGTPESSRNPENTKGSGNGARGRTVAAKADGV